MKIDQHVEALVSTALANVARGTRESKEEKGEKEEMGEAEKGQAARLLSRPREEGKSDEGHYSATIPKTQKKVCLFFSAAVHMQRIVRGFLGRLAVKHIMIEYTAKLDGILVAFRPAGTIQGQAGWYVAKGELFYFALDKGEFVLLAGPLSANDYDAVLDDMHVQSITAHAEFSGEIEVDRMGLHAARWQLQSMKAQLEAANFELSQEGAVHECIDALKADSKEGNKQVASWTEKHSAAEASLTEKAADGQRVAAAIAVDDKQLAQQYQADSKNMTAEPTRSLNLVTYLARDYDDALSFFVTKLGFELVEDEDRGAGRRWLVVKAGAGSGGLGLVITKAVSDASLAAVGNQAGSEVGFFLQTDDFMRDYEAWMAAGVKFREPPRHEVYGIVSVFEDLYGNGWDLIQRPLHA